MTAIGLCALCGAPLAPDGSRRCSCSRFLDVMTIAAMRARRHGRARPDALDVRLARVRLDAGRT